MVIILLADGFEEVEALAPLDIMLRAGIDVKTASIGELMLRGAHGIKVEADMLATDVNEDEIEMLVLPGGMPGTTNLDKSPYTERFIAATCKNGGHIAAICAAPSILGKRGLLRGKEAICFPGFETYLDGATVRPDMPVVTSGSFTTAKDFRAANSFGDELTEIYLRRKDS